MSEENGVRYRLEGIEKDVSAMREQVQDLPIVALTGAIEKLSGKIEVLTTTHLKIIYWLLILISSVLLGTEGVKLYKVATTTIGDIKP